MVLRSFFFPCGSRFPSLPGVCSAAATPVFLQVLHTHPWPQHPPPALTFGSVCWVSCSVTRGVIPFKRVFLGASPVADVKDATLQHPPISQNPRSWNQPVAKLRRTMRQRGIPSPLPPDGPHAFSFPCKALETQRMRIFAVAPGCCGADTPDFWVPFFSGLNPGGEALRGRAASGSGAELELALVCHRPVPNLHLGSAGHRPCPAQTSALPSQRLPNSASDAFALFESKGQLRKHWIRQ